MKAKYDSTRNTKFTISHRREGKCFFSSVSVVDLTVPPHRDKTLSTTIELRLYGTGNVNFACLWVHSDPTYTYGSGRAGGYGYHRHSAAAGEAIRNAGFELLTDDGNPCDIGGVGGIRHQRSPLRHC